MVGAYGHLFAKAIGVRGDGSGASQRVKASYLPGHTAPEKMKQSNCARIWSNMTRYTPVSNECDPRHDTMAL